MHVTGNRCNYWSCLSATLMCLSSQVPCGERKRVRIERKNRHRPNNVKFYVIGIKTSLYVQWLQCTRHINKKPSRQRVRLWHCYSCWHMTEHVLSQLTDNNSPGRDKVSLLPACKAVLVSDWSPHIVIQCYLVTLYKYRSRRSLEREEAP